MGQPVQCPNCGQYMVGQNTTKEELIARHQERRGCKLGDSQDVGKALLIKPLTFKGNTGSWKIGDDGRPIGIKYPTDSEEQKAPEGTTPRETNPSASDSRVL